MPGLCQDGTRTEAGLGQGWVRIWLRFEQYWTKIGSGMGMIGEGLGLDLDKIWSVLDHNWVRDGPGLG